MQINKLIIIILIPILIILGGCVKKEKLEDKDFGVEGLNNIESGGRKNTREEVGEKKIVSNQLELNNQTGSNNNSNQGSKAGNFFANEDEINGIEGLLSDLEKDFSGLDNNDISGETEINLDTEI